jgi:hypothetical protein
MKRRGKRRKPNQLVNREYQQFFAPHSLPFNGICTDSDSLEQPSVLKYVDSTTIPATEVAIDPQTR